MRARWLWLFLLGCIALAAPAAQDGGTLDIYYVDVEGGAATLLIAPSGESMLVDTGHPGTVDAGRIAAAAADAGLEQIDYLVTTHYHLDHVGGTPEVAATSRFAISWTTACRRRPSSTATSRCTTSTSKRASRGATCR